MQKSDFLCQNRLWCGRISRCGHQKFQNWLKITIFMTFLKFQKFWFFFSKMYRELRENIQVLKTGPLESDENWHAAIKWRVMTKCKRCILAKNVLGRRYLIFFVWRGVWKCVFWTFLSFASFWCHHDQGRVGHALGGCFVGKKPCVDIFCQFLEILKIN